MNQQQASSSLAASTPRSSAIQVHAAKGARRGQPNSSSSSSSKSSSPTLGDLAALADAEASATTIAEQIRDL
jgi:hypothetical protein